MLYVVLLVFAVGMVVLSIRAWEVYEKVHEALPGLIRDEPSTEYEIIEALRQKGIIVGSRMLYMVARSLEAVIVIEESDDDSDGCMSVMMRYRRRKMSDGFARV